MMMTADKVAFDTNHLCKNYNDEWFVFISGVHVNIYFRVYNEGDGDEQGFLRLRLEYIRLDHSLSQSAGSHIRAR